MNIPISLTKHTTQCTPFRWASRRLQRLSRQRAECTIAHVYALVRHWDRMFPTRPPSPPLPSLSPSLERSTSPRPSKSDPISPNHPTSTAVQTATASTAKKNSKQQPVPRRGARGGGAASKTSKRRGRAKASRARKTKKGAGTNEAKSCESYDEDEKKRRVYVSDEAKEEEIVCWLRRTREIHVRELSAYERHTVSAVREAAVTCVYLHQSEQEVCAADGVRK